MSPQSVRLAWILGLAGGAAAIVGGVAYASSAKGGKTPAPGKTTAPVGTPPTGANVLTIPLQEPGQNFTEDDLAGYTLVILFVQPGFWNVSITDGSGNIISGSTFNPNAGAFDGPTPAGAFVTVPLTGLGGSIVITGTTTAAPASAAPGTGWTSTITLQPPPNP